MNRKELEAMGISAENIQKIMDMHMGATEAKKAEIEKLEGQLKEANKQLKDANDKLKEMDGKDETINKLQKQMEDYIASENARIEKEKAEKADRELTEKIVAAFPKDKEFTSDYVRNGIIADIKAKMSEDSTVGVKEIFERLTKDKEGIFKNAQQQRLTLPGVHNESKNTDPSEYLDAKYGKNPFYKGGK